eukprot:3719559-Pleurochrysis_carterae.AAC.2
MPADDGLSSSTGLSPLAGLYLFVVSTMSSDPLASRRTLLCILPSVIPHTYAALRLCAVLPLQAESYTHPVLRSFPRLPSPPRLHLLEISFPHADVSTLTGLCVYADTPLHSCPPTRVDSHAPVRLRAPPSWLALLISRSLAAIHLHADARANVGLCACVVMYPLSNLL